MAAKKPPRNDATYCRLKGWAAGTVLTIEVDTIANGGFYTGKQYMDRCRITAVGEQAILVRRVYDNGRESSEQRWVRRLINKLVVGAAPALDPEAR